MPCPLLPSHPQAWDIVGSGAAVTISLNATFGRAGNRDPGLGHTAAAITLSPSRTRPDVVISGGHDGAVYVWTLTQWWPIQALPYPGSGPSTSAVVTDLVVLPVSPFNPAECVAIAYGDGRVWVWQWQANVLLRSLAPVPASIGIYCLVLSRDRTLLGGLGDGRVALWDAASGNITSILLVSVVAFACLSPHSPA